MRTREESRMLGSKPRSPVTDRRRATPRVDALRVVTVPCATRDPFRFLAAFPDATPRVLLEDAAAGVTLAGVGAAVTLEAHGAERYRTVREDGTRVLRNVRHDAPVDATDAGVRPRFIGAFAFFDDHDATGAWDAFPAAWAVLPRLLLTVTPEGAWLTLTAPAREPGLAATAADAARVAEGDARVPDAPPVHVAVEDPAARAAWMEDAGRVVRALAEGAAGKAVLARASSAACDVDPLALAARLPRGGSARFLLEPAKGHAFAGATPETLVTLHGTRVRSAAIAATAPRGGSPEEDAAIAGDVFERGKEQEEHALVVDAIRDALADVSTDVTVAPTPDVIPAAAVQHLRTRVEATLAARGHVLDLVARLHPTPAVGGTPRDAALDLVRSVERFARGWYAAPVGWFDADGNGAFHVAIRSARVTPGQVTAFAGAGLLPASEPNAEFNETAAKLAAVAGALLTGGEPRG